MAEIKRHPVQYVLLVFGALAVLTALCVYALKKNGLYLNLGEWNTRRVISCGRFWGVAILGAWVLWRLAHAHKEYWTLSLLFVLGALFYVLSLLVLLVSSFFEETEPSYFYFVSPDGAHSVIVEEESWLLGGWGSFYAPVSPGLMRKTGSYSTDDGFRPFTVGAYELEWGDILTVRYDFGSACGNRWTEVRLPLE